MAVCIVHKEVRLSEGLEPAQSHFVHRASLLGFGDILLLARRGHENGVFYFPSHGGFPDFSVTPGWGWLLPVSPVLLMDSLYIHHMAFLKI